MQKIKKRGKLVLLGVLLFTLITMNGYLPKVDAAMTSVSDTLSDSDTSATDVTHTIQFTIGTALTSGQYYQFTIPVDFSGFATSSIDCPDPIGSTTKQIIGTSATGYDIRCTAAGDIATGTKTFIATSTTNISIQGDYTIGVYTKTAANAEIEGRDTKIYIIDEVSVSATVNATLSFAISTTTPDDAIHGENMTGTSSPTSVAFGTITSTDGPYIMGHDLTVSTNADNGYTVTVEQDKALQTGAGATIDSYSTSATSTWGVPAGNYLDDTTWGHWAVTSDDTEYFQALSFKGLDGTTALPVLAHSGPVNGATDGVGIATVAYKLAITDLQEAGDYSNTLTYICTPTY
ncbi:MAG: hypothetical protein U9R06_00765 [Patescibacteria group bacterium]|nr:hypothetical protein [Patescibacteria group bacterium]